MYAKYKYMQNGDKLRDILCYGIFLLFRRFYKSEINDVIGNLEIFRQRISRTQCCSGVAGTCAKVFRNFSNIYQLCRIDFVRFLENRRLFFMIFGCIRLKTWNFRPLFEEVIRIFIQFYLDTLNISERIKYIKKNNNVLKIISMF